ncbi:extracellular solute-binding protein [Cohnella terricola]|uniref:Extracellular solute-binding protein n=2 Tax=Cohnella terricola TaxID=1289167 RepID=A0A559JNK3_9BACL|nr:extracellular solute-binding protein [Cohnella terricola]
MLKQRKPFLVALVLLMAWTLAACSGGNNSKGEASSPPPSEGGSSPSASEPASPSPSKEEEVTLKFYFGGDKKAATDEVWGKVSEYLKAKGLNVKFDVNFIPFGDFKDKMLVMAASGDKWDLNFDGDWLSYKLMAAKGSYMALNDLLPQYAPNLTKKYQEQGTLEAATVNGEIVGLPWTMKMNQRYFVGWRQDLAEKAGIIREPDSVKTIEDVDKFLHELRQAYPNEKLSRTPAQALFMTRDEWVDLGFHQMGFYLNDPEVKIQAVEEQPFYKEASLLTKKWYDDKIINRDAMYDKEGAEDQWRNGKLLFTMTSHEWAFANPGFSDPSFKQQMFLLYPDKKFVNRTALANVLAINRNSEHPDRVLRFLDMMETDKTLYDLVQYGIEGKTYVLDGDVAVYPEGMTFTTSNYMEWGGQWAFWKPQFMRPNQTYEKDFWVKEAEFASLPINVNSPVDGLFIAEDNIKNEIAKRDQLYEELGKPIEYGVAKDVDGAIADYTKKQKNAGRDKIIAEAQKQIDAYLASKKQ